MGRSIFGFGYGTVGTALVLCGVWYFSVTIAQTNAGLPTSPGGIELAQAPTNKPRADLHGNRPEPFVPQRDSKEAAKPKADSGKKDSSSLKTQFMRGFFDAIDNITGKELESKEKDRLKDEIRQADELYDRIKTSNREAIRQVNRQQQFQNIHARNIILITASGMGFGDVGADHPKPIPPEAPAEPEKKNAAEKDVLQEIATQAVVQPQVIGPPRIRTPHLDSLAANGLRFSNFYASAKGDESSRWKLLRGLKTGKRTTFHLDPDDVSLADVLWRAGYTTGMVGNCYLGPFEKRFVSPTEIGFDFAFGFLDKKLLTDHYPATLWKNDTLVKIDSNQGGRKEQHVQELFTEVAKAFITANRGGRPFFLYLPYTTPRDNWEVPDRADYASGNWPNQQQAYASVVSRIDRDIEQIREHLERTGLLGRTTIIFATDSPRQDAAGVDRNYFESDGPAPGRMERIDAGVRSPLIIYNARGASVGHVVDRECDYTDLAATILDLANAFQRPAGWQGVSLVREFVAPAPVKPDPAPAPVNATENTGTKFQDT